MAKGYLIKTYVLKKSLLGKGYSAHFNCPNGECGIELTQSESEIGGTDSCPQCGVAHRLTTTILDSKKRQEENVRNEKEQKRNRKQQLRQEQAKLIAWQEKRINEEQESDNDDEDWAPPVRVQQRRPQNTSRHGTHWLVYFAKSFAAMLRAEDTPRHGSRWSVTNVAFLKAAFALIQAVAVLGGMAIFVTGLMLEDTSAMLSFTVALAGPVWMLLILAPVLFAQNVLHYLERIAVSSERN